MNTMSLALYNKNLRSIYIFLSDPSPVIGNACNSLTHSRLVNLIDVTLSCEDAYSQLDEVVTIADVSDEDCAGMNKKPFTW